MQVWPKRKRPPTEAASNSVAKSGVGTVENLRTPIGRTFESVQNRPLLKIRAPPPPCANSAVPRWSICALARRARSRLPSARDSAREPFAGDRGDFLSEFNEQLFVMAASITVERSPIGAQPYRLFVGHHHFGSAIPAPSPFDHLHRARNKFDLSHGLLLFRAGAIPGSTNGA